MPEISVVAPVRNGAARLERFFAALDAQTLDAPRFEVVLVDDGSTDETPRLAAEWQARDPARHRVVPGPGAGPAAARNVGIAHARGEWIASTDADVEPDPAWLETALAQLRRTAAPALEGAIATLDGGSANGALTPQTNLTGGRYMTGNMIYRRSLVDELGGFDERFEQAFLEDSDLGFRILEDGHDIPFAPDVVVRHPLVERDPVGTLRSANRAVWFALFAAKHPVLYRTRLRPIVRPLNAIELDVLAGLAAAAAATRARGLPRLVLLALAANGLKRGVVPALRDVPPAQQPAAAAAAIATPPLRAFWWLVGCVRFRKAVW